MSRHTVLDHTALARALVYRRRISGTAADGAEASRQPIGRRGTGSSLCEATSHCIGTSVPPEHEGTVDVLSLQGVESA